MESTLYNLDGTVCNQLRRLSLGHNLELKATPPWLWNVTDQTTPSIPAWMKDDEQWQRALDAQDR